jgi:hypothetical protein
MPCCRRISTERRQRIARLVTAAIALYSAAGLPRINNDSAIADTSRPGMNRVGNGVDLPGVASTQRDGIRSLKITIHLVIARQAVARPKRKDRE